MQFNDKKTLLDYISYTLYKTFIQYFFTFFSKESIQS